jgi:beta-glucosidase
MLFNPQKTAEEWGKAEATARTLLTAWPTENKLSLLVGQNGKFPQDAFNYKGYLNPHNPSNPSVLQGRKTNYAQPLRMNEGPQGFVPSAGHEGTTTQFPALLTVAATFNPEASRRYAEAVAKEFTAKGANVLLGPDLEVIRAPLAGRSFQTLSGEDPYLGSRLVQPYVSELNKHGIISVVRHWLDNTQETYEKSMNVEVGSRAQREVYSLPFKAAFTAGAGATMCAYNRVSGQPSCENRELMRQLLRDELAFRGFVMSEWGAIVDAERSANGGVDVEMPGGPHGKFMYLHELFKDGKVPALENQAVHVVASMVMAGHFDQRFQPPPALTQASWDAYDLHTAVDEVQKSDVTSKTSRTVALDTIIDGAVLLKNRDSTLPLKLEDRTRIALVGEHCEEFAAKRAGGKTISLEPADLEMWPFKGTAVDLRWSADASAAQGADTAVICAAAPAAQGWDRKSLELPKVKALVNSVRMQLGHKRIVVVATVPGAVTTEWIEHVDAAMILFMPGEQVGHAVAELLFGAASPAGRLPISLPNPDEKRFDTKQYPGECPPPNTWCKKLTAHFSEGLMVGYRWNDAKGVPSAFPFGHGLTYTEFKFHSFWIDCANDKVAVHLKIKNTGWADGKAVPQLYVGFENLMPVLRQLRGFLKVPVPKGGEADATFILDNEDWSFYDEASGRWKNAIAEGNVVTVSVGSSSADLNWSSPLNCEFLSTTDNSGLVRPLFFGP